MKTRIKFTFLSLSVILIVTNLFAQNTGIPPAIDIQCDSCVLFVWPTLKQIDRIKASYPNEEDFYTMADDANNYAVSAFEYLADKNVNVIYLDSIKRVCFNRGDTLDFTEVAWDFVLYDKNKSPKTVPAIDLTWEFENYFKQFPYFAGVYRLDEVGRACEQGDLTGLQKLVGAGRSLEDCMEDDIYKSLF